MNDAVDMSLWTGRVDPEPDTHRWHQQVQPLTGNAVPGIVLHGFVSDAGVSRNKGRTGAAAGPDAIRGMLANLAWHGTAPVYDAGNVACKEVQNGPDLETAQAE